MNPELRGLIAATRKAANDGPAGLLCDYLEDGLAEEVPAPEKLRWAVRRLRWRINEMLRLGCRDRVWVRSMLEGSLEEIRQVLGMPEGPMELENVFFNRSAEDLDRQVLNPLTVGDLHIREKPVDRP